MINQVSSTNLLKNYQPKQAVFTEKSQETPQIASEIINRETAAATKSYAGFVAPPPRKVPEKKSLNDLKADFIAQGKVEGKDFKIENCGDKQGVYGCEFIVLENDKPVKKYYYSNDGSKKEDFGLITEIFYPTVIPTIANGNSINSKVKSVETTYGSEGDFCFRKTRYEKDSSPYIDELVNYEIKPYELEQKLKANGIKYANDIEYSNDNANLEQFMINKITAFNPRTNEVTRYEFTYNKATDKVEDVTKSIIDIDGNKVAEIRFRKDETDFVELKDCRKY